MKSNGIQISPTKTYIIDIMTFKLILIEQSMD
jgi:hypothetical protein